MEDSERIIILAKQVLSQLSYTPTVELLFILKHFPVFRCLDKTATTVLKTVVSSADSAFFYPIRRYSSGTCCLSCD